MSLSRFITGVRTGAVFTHLLAMGRLMAMTMLIPALVAALHRDLIRAVGFVAVAAALYMSGWLGRRLASPAAQSIDMREALVVTALAYLLYAAAGAAVLATALAPVDALFESMSGITTTGLTVADPAALPRSLVFFRGYSQWLGGAGIAILSLAVIFGTGKSAMALYQRELPASDIMGNVRTTARVVAAIYLALSVAAAGVLKRPRSTALTRWWR